MPLEIERRWLPNGEAWRKLVTTENYLDITQGYIARETGNAVRIRLCNNAQIYKATLCIKGVATREGVPEYEYQIKDREEALALLRLCGKRVLQKRRWFVMVDGLKFEVDEFRDWLYPLVLIELELQHKDSIVIPPLWVGEEVTGLMQYNNAHLVEFGPPSNIKYVEAP